MNRGRTKLVAVLISLLTLVSVSFAGKHPVPLDPKADPKTCLECHEDKMKGASVHSAMQMGCTSCHEIRVNRDVTRLKLITTTPQALCITCHSDKDAKEIKGRVHPPAVRDCLKCHDPHSSGYKNNLKLPPEGATAKENICLTCHAMGVNVPEGGSRHAALDMGCNTCHVTHKTGERGKMEFDYHLTKSTPALCMDCHDVNDESLRKAHDNQPFDKTDCVSCHDPHQSKSPHLLQAYVHAPFSDKDSCSTCHQAPKDGKVVLTADSPKALCLTCHDDKGKQIDEAKVPHPGAMGDCTDCHSPHAGKSPGMPKPDAVQVCLNCHSDQADQYKKAHLHQPAFKQGCATCHEPHGGDNPKLLRAKSVNALCLECHGPDAQPQRLASEHMVTIFNGKVRLPENYFAQVPVLPIKYGRGHPVEGHPVENQVDPTSATKAQMTCLSCHQPHSSAQPGLLVKDQANNMMFCAACHKDLGK